MAELSKQAQAKIEKLRIAYIAKLPDKFTEIDHCWVEVKKNPCQKDNLRSLAALCHKYAGSAGAYGLDKLANALLEIESDCMRCLEGEFVNDDSYLRQLESRYCDLITIVNSDLYV